MNSAPARFFAACSLAALGAAAGCATHHHAAPPAPAAASAAASPVRMEGAGAFFGGQLAVTITVGGGLSRSAAGGTSSGGRHGRHSGAGDDATDSGGSLRVDSPMPPVVLHLKFKNRSKRPLSFTIDDFESDLGNFAVHPETLTLAAGQSGEPDPMTSQLGVTADALPMKLTLKRLGVAESQTLTVKTWEDPALSEWPGIRE